MRSRKGLEQWDGRPLTASMCQSGSIEQLLEPGGASSWMITTIGIDLAKNILKVDAVNQHGNVVLKKQIKRDKIETFSRIYGPA
jgi:hypothetical protein